MSAAQIARAMAAAGCTADQIARALESTEAEKRESRREGNRIRQERFRARNASNANNVDNADNAVLSVTSVTETAGNKKEIPPTPPKEKTTLPDNPTDYLPHPGLTTSKRGSRLPADWTPPAEIVDFGVSVGFEASEIRGTLLDEFRDYWCPLTGAKSTKLDWAATYRNRLREIAQRRKRTSAPRLAFSNSAQPPPYVSPFAVSKGPELSREEQLEIGRRFSEQWARK